MFKVTFHDGTEPVTVAGEDFTEAPDFVTFHDGRSGFAAAVRTDRVLMVEKLPVPATDGGATGA